jgi:hypothetical protein
MELASIIEQAGTDTPEECIRAMTDVIKYLNMPPGLMVVYDPLTRTILYPTRTGMAP